MPASDSAATLARVQAHGRSTYQDIHNLHDVSERERERESLIMTVYREIERERIDRERE